MDWIDAITAVGAALVPLAALLYPLKRPDKTPPDQPKQD
ncbi:hypothetical protein GJA_2277 [Janthinobacterium agaricidamnosum NBRC 102515 = DSM 9628]|uniref:Transmembrane protein n=1 Tax=Janthinobacterium agaricidamnosum NBRC 102515 = DSM 9628 TaxID=1349767 RepID=W0V4W5_9BURK|nr:hypothetical protein GJA_2277 [Janthinobacterium agaricidamnosum NBRC 102515 = DSM 9628]